MASKILLCFLTFLSYVISMSSGCFYNMMHNPSPMSEDDPPNEFGKPLFLTPMIENGDVDRARHVSKVGHLPNFNGHVRSYSGFLTVNKDLGSHLFFWFFPAMNKDRSAPIVIWLQGGPGLSSLIGVFAGNGPLQYNWQEDKLLKRNESWASTLNVLYIDNPVGTGFSFTKGEEGYATNQTQITEELFAALNQFFTVFHHYKSNNIYIAGEGYACKYIAGLAHRLHAADGGPHELELKGISIGNGVCDPFSLQNHTNLLYQSGLIDRMQMEAFQNHSIKLGGLLTRKRSSEAFDELAMMFRDQPSTPSYFRQITGMENLYDIRYTKISKDLYAYTRYLSTAAARKALHVGMIPFNNHRTVCRKLQEDFTHSVKPSLELILNNYKVLFYHGQLDLVVPYTQFTGFLGSLSWRRATEKSKRILWGYEGKNDTRLLAGYVHHVGDFYQVLVWKAGHFVPYDAPKAAHDMFMRFVWGKSFH